MAITRSIRNKLFVLLIIMGSLPLIIATMVSAVNMTEELETNAEKIGLLKNSIVSQYLTELCEKNFHVLKSLALNPMIIQYLQNPDSSKLREVQNLLHDTNTIFHDRNLTALTGADAQQLIRTDGKPLVNLSGRQHFHEAMRGRSFVSDILISRSTGERIVVLEVPVTDKLNNPIGMVQRNLNLSVLQHFVKEYDTEEILIIVMDRVGKTIAHSDKTTLEPEDTNSNFGRYKYIADKMQKSSGTLRTRIDGKDVIASYSRNWKTDWIIVTVQPYSKILEQVYIRIFKTVVLGIIILSLIFIAAYVLSIKATKPLIQFTKVADKIISGNGKIEKIEINSDDEFGQMAAAFNKIRSARDAYQLESELDPLTKLYNKATTENFGRMKLQTFKDTKDNDTIMALYMIDLDHFKEANDTYGHQFGDKVLVEFSKNLRKKFRPNDCIGRFGGDEFVVIIDNLPTIEIVNRKAREIKQVALDLVIDGINAGITASVGIAIIPQDGTDYETVFKAADTALYYVKNNGRNGFYYKNIDTSTKN